MNQIAAADNITIDMQPNRWSMMVNGEGDVRVLLEAVAGEPLRYVPRFGTTRRLPVTGTLPTDTVQRVVLGWSNLDEAWHLGLVFGGELATERGSRWCEIAHWPDPDGTVFIELAADAGKSLANTLARPFTVIPRRVEEKPAPPPPPPLPDLPLKFGGWTLEWVNPKKKRAETDADAPSRHLQLTRSSSWTLSKITRLLWYGMWTVVYIVLSLATLTSGLAMPNSGTMLPDPKLLPYLGLISAAILLGMMLYILYELVAKPDRIVIDPAARAVTAQRGPSVRWRLEGEAIHSVYVTQVMGKKDKKYQVEHAELNLHLGGENFRRIFQQEKQDDRAHPWKAETSTGADMVTPLTRETVNSDVQAAGLYIAEALGEIPCWYDRRVK